MYLYGSHFHARGNCLQPTIIVTEGEELHFEHSAKESSQLQKQARDLVRIPRPVEVPAGCRRELVQASELLALAPQHN